MRSNITTHPMSQLFFKTHPLPEWPCSITKKLPENEEEIPLNCLLKLAVYTYYAKASSRSGYMLSVNAD